MNQLKRIIAFFFIIIIVLGFMACTPQIAEEHPRNPEQNLQEPAEVEEPKEPEEPEEADEPKADPIDLKAIKANENGQVMILMYHGIGEKEAVWTRTAENFRKDLEVLYNKGYRLISLKDFVENNIKAEFVLSHLVELEKIEVSNQEIEEMIEAAGDPSVAEQMQDPMQKLYIKTILEKNKLLTKLIEDTQGPHAHEENHEKGEPESEKKEE